jgi:hypothetical protein
MEDNHKNKYSFLQALIVTIIIFAIGLIFGFFLESFRADKTQNLLLNSEISLQDEQLRNSVINNLNLSCEDSSKSLFKFANKIYEEAIQLEKYDGTTKFTDSLFLMHKKYDLLRMMLWIESANMKKHCKPNFHTIVYIYDYKTEDVDKVSMQNFYSKALIDIKTKYPNETLLIPIAGNTNLESVNLALKSHNITETPCIIIDDTKKITGIFTIQQLEQTIFAPNSLNKK